MAGRSRYVLDPIYQVYVPSFADGNGDGVGDLAGLTGRLDHLADLGVAALWLSPIHPSGGADCGYDVTDYVGIDPVYGDLADLDDLLAGAHRRGLGVLLDFVPNHTSDRHPWFEESRSSRGSSRRDWYVWADGRDGDPPNNWRSMFDTSSWQWDGPTGQYFLASHYPEQPDLNWENPLVRRAVTDAMRFWIDRGVDGFRLDVVHRLSKDPELRDNPVEAPAPQGTQRPRPHATGLHDLNGPRAHEFVREIRDAVGPEALLVGEVWMFDSDEVAKYTAQGELDLALNFAFAFSPWDAGAMATAVERTERAWAGGRQLCYHLSNHDTPRHATRFGELAVGPAAVLLLTLRGTPVMYYGEEIGMADGFVSPERRVDRLGRDPCRTPMQWSADPNAGFCPEGAEPWLPVAEGFERRNVMVASGEPDSVLGLYRRLLALRGRSPALRHGSYRRVEAPVGALAFLREARRERLLVAVSFGPEASTIRTFPGRVVAATQLEREGEDVPGELRLDGNQAAVVRLSGERG